MSVFRDLFMEVLASQSSYKPAEDLNEADNERVSRYQRNLKYYMESQYGDEVQYRQDIDWTSLEAIRKFVANCTSAVSEVVDIKSSWIYGKAARRVLGLKGVDPTSEKAKDQTVKETLQAVKELRADSDRDTWDIISAMNGAIYGDFYRFIDFSTVDQTVQIVEEDPRFCFPQYDRSGKHLIRFVQHFLAGELDDEGHEVEYYRTWTIENVHDLFDSAMQHMDPDDIEEHWDSLKELDSDSKALVYREFRDDELVDYRMDIGFDEIPWVHGRNLQLNGSFGLDELSKLIPKIEKLNAIYRYAERVMYVNAHAKVALIGVEGSKARAGTMNSGETDVLTVPNPQGDAKVLTLPSDVAMMKFVSEGIEKSIYKTASIPPIALADDLTTVGQLSGLALKILYGPLAHNTELRQNFYELADRDTYRIALKAREYVDGSTIGDKYPNPLIDYVEWVVPVPESESDLVNDVVKEYQAGIISKETAIEKLGYPVEQEKQRIKAEQEANVESLKAAEGVGYDTFDEPVEGEEVE